MSEIRARSVSNLGNNRITLYIGTCSIISSRLSPVNFSQLTSRYSFRTSLPDCLAARSDPTDHPYSSSSAPLPCISSLKSLDESTLWSHVLVPAIGSGLGVCTIDTKYLVRGRFPPESSSQKFWPPKLAWWEARLRHAFEFSRHSAPGFHHGCGLPPATGPAQSTTSPNSISRTHPRFIGAALAGLGAVWAMGPGEPLPQDVLRFGWKRSFFPRSLFVGPSLETLHRNFPFFCLPGLPCSPCPPCRALGPRPRQRPTELAISARTRELPSLDSVTWRKASCSIGCHCAENALLFPHGPGPLEALPETLYGTVSCRLYFVARSCTTDESSENQQSFLGSPSTRFLQHTPASAVPTVLLTITALGPNPI